VGLENGLFPLTPALSPQEREQPPARLENLDALRSGDRQASILPLPEGEGWGERGAVGRLNAATDASKPCWRRGSHATI
jgi:hypothetical protein